MVLLPNNPIMSGTSIRLFRHLEHQKLFIISDYISRARTVHQLQRSKRSQIEGVGGVGGVSLMESDWMSRIIGVGLEESE